MINYLRNCCLWRKDPENERKVRAKPTAQQTITHLSQANLDALTATMCATQYFGYTTEVANAIKTYIPYVAIGNTALFALLFCIKALRQTYCGKDLHGDAPITASLDIAKQLTFFIQFFLPKILENLSTTSKENNDLSSTFFMICNLIPNAINLLKAIFLQASVTKRKCTIKGIYSIEERQGYKERAYNLTEESPSYLGSIANTVGNSLFLSGMKFAGSIITIAGHGLSALTHYGLFAHKASYTCCANKTCCTGNEENQPIINPGYSTYK